MRQEKKQRLINQTVPQRFKNFGWDMVEGIKALVTEKDEIEIRVISIYSAFFGLSGVFCTGCRGQFGRFSNGNYFISVERSSEILMEKVRPAVVKNIEFKHSRYKP